MECLFAFACPKPFAIVRPSLVCGTKTNRRNGVLRAKLGDENDPLLFSAVNAASLRFQETHRPEPLFVDPYAGCFVPPNIQTDLKKHSNHYCLATKFIDDKLLQAVNRMDGHKQVVLLTDGMDTRPYRLKWPTSTIIFDVSPERVFKKAASELEGVGAKIPRGCMFLHIPLECPNIQQSLHAKGFHGNRPSIWAIQGLPLMALSSFKDILFVVSGLTMNGCLFLGELPALLAETECGTKCSRKKWMDKLFMGNGYRVEMISYNDIAASLGKEVTTEEYNILFLAEQLRFSDDQMEAWRREFMRVEEEGDEEGFEEL